MTDRDLKAALPPDTALGRVRLQVRDAGRAAEFYDGVLGLEESSPANGTSMFGGAGGDAVLGFVEDPSTEMRPPGTRGLYHVALLMPDRSSLAAALARLLAAEYPLQGFADHHVSEAVYLADPDGNGLELYADRPASAWKRSNGRIFMTTRPLDVPALLDARSGSDPHRAPAGTRVGHIHLQVGDLAAAERFYHGILGFDVVNREFPGALFLSAGGYHHHIGLNTWGRPGPSSDRVAGLVDFEVCVPDAAVRRRLAGRAGSAAPADDGPIPIVDPDGNRLHITA